MQNGRGLFRPLADIQTDSGTISWKFETKLSIGIEIYQADLFAAGEERERQSIRGAVEETEIHIGQSSLLVEFSLLRRDDGSIDFAQLLLGLAISRHDAGQERPRAPDLRDPSEALRHGLAFPGDEVAGSELRRDQSIPRIFEVRKSHLVDCLQVIPDHEAIPQ